MPKADCGGVSRFQNNVCFTGYFKDENGGRTNVDLIARCVVHRKYSMIKMIVGGNLCYFQISHEFL